MTRRYRPTPQGNTTRLGLTIPREPIRSATTRLVRIMPAKYPGRCLDCGAPFTTGTSIVWTRGQGARCAGGHTRSLPGGDDPGAVEDAEPR